MHRIAYLFSTFPGLSTTFMQHQVAATRRLGLDALLFSTRAPKPGGYHPQDKGLYQETRYLSRMGLLPYLKENVMAMAVSPASYWKGIKLALTLSDHFPWQRLRNFMHLAGAAVLAKQVKNNGGCHIHVHFAFGAAGVAIFADAIANIPYSITIHGSDVLLPRPLTKEKLKRARFVVSNCQFHINNLRRRYPSLESQRFYIVRGGLNTQTGKWAKYTAPLIGRPLSLLNVARLEPVKAQDVLIKACALLNERGVEFICRIVGDGPEKESLEHLIRKLGLSDSVLLLGRRYQDEVNHLYDISQVVVLSSLSEGTPMTLIEAMAKARPVVAPDITALPEMVTHGENGFLFQKASPEDLADKLMKFSKTPDLVTQMGLAGRKRAENDFDEDKNARHLISIFAKEVPVLELAVNGV